MAARVDFPITVVGALRSTTGNFAAAADNPFADDSSPGAIMPPTNSPFLSITSNVVVVSRLTTTNGEPNRSRAPIISAIRSAPSSEGSLYPNRIPVLSPGPTCNGVRPHSIVNALTQALVIGGATEAIMLPCIFSCSKSASPAETSEVFVFPEIKL